MFQQNTAARLFTTIAFQLSFLGTFLVLMGASPAQADIKSAETGQTSFIKVTLLPGPPESDPSKAPKFVRFEQCQTQTPSTCKTLGARDYAIDELENLHDELLKQATETATWSLLNVLEVVGGVIGGASLGCAAGGAIGLQGAFLPAVAGCGAGIIVGGIGGGIGAYYWVNSNKSSEIAQLDSQAQDISEVIQGDPIQINTDIDGFAHSLTLLLDKIPS